MKYDIINNIVNNYTYVPNIFKYYIISMYFYILYCIYNIQYNFHSLQFVFINLRFVESKLKVQIYSLQRTTIDFPFQIDRVTRYWNPEGLITFKIRRSCRLFVNATACSDNHFRLALDIRGTPNRRGKDMIH